LRDDVGQGIGLDAVESLRQIVKISFQNLRSGRFTAGCKIIRTRSLSDL
jgi:hypothetical protein